MEYSIKSVEEVAENCYMVQVRISNKDFIMVMSDVIDRAYEKKTSTIFNIVIGNGADSFWSIYRECKNNVNAIVETEVMITVEKDDNGNWAILDEVTIYDLIFAALGIE